LYKEKGIKRQLDALAKFVNSLTEKQLRTVAVVNKASEFGGLPKLSSVVMADEDSLIIIIFENLDSRDTKWELWREEALENFTKVLFQAKQHIARGIPINRLVYEQHQKDVITAKELWSKEI